MYYLILILPLISATVAGFGGRYIGEKGAGRFTTTLILITSFLSWITFYEVGIQGSPTYLTLFKWIESGGFLVEYGLQFDSVTVTMLILVTTVSGLVHLYSTEYMNGDPHLPRFMSYLSLFTFNMIILVTADNFLQLFIGWEGVGLCSYLLISFWYTRIEANKSAIQAMVMNRVGDVSLALAMFIIFITYKSLDYATVFALVGDSSIDTSFSLFNMEVNVLTCIGLLLLGGAVGKSAQLGLHTWLPEAMEGPTPVSALIHAATMVTAGVFLLIRCSPLLEYTPTALTVITIIGTLTAFFAASVGLVQNDIKKVIAYSTCSQLGYMVLACGLSNYAVSLFHLLNHGFFKALLFLSAGSVIHAMHDEQDMRKLGGLIHSTPFTYSMMLIGSLSLMGFPFLTGFYSKDAILEWAFATYTIDGTFAHWLGSLAALFTAFYSLRLLYLTFIANPHSSQSTYQMSHESPLPMTIPLFILSIGSIFVGYFFRDMFIGFGSDFLGNAVFIKDSHYIMAEAEFIDPTIIKWIPVILSIFGACLAVFLLHSTPHVLTSFKASFFGNRLYTFLSNKWHFGYLYNYYIAKPCLEFGHNVSYKVLDRGLIESMGPTGISRVIVNLSQGYSSHVATGLLYNSAFSIVVATTVLTIIYFFSPLLGHWVDLLLILPILAMYSNSRD
jgi:NADH-ubiquinone oxidoreductase chain 5